MAATDWYSVAIEARSPSGAGHVDDDTIARFADLLQPDSGVCGAGGIPPRWDARISIGALGMEEAVRVGPELILRLASEAGLSTWPVVRIEATREDVLDQELVSPAMPDLVSGPEAAAILGVSNQRLHQLAVTHSRFPDPAYQFPGAKVWHRAAIEKFNEKWSRKPGRPRKAPSAA